MAPKNSSGSKNQDGGNKKKKTAGSQQRKKPFSSYTDLVFTITKPNIKLFLKDDLSEEDKKTAWDIVETIMSGEIVIDKTYVVYPDNPYRLSSFIKVDCWKTLCIIFSDILEGEKHKKKPRLEPELQDEISSWMSLIIRTYVECVFYQFGFTDDEFRILELGGYKVRYDYDTQKSWKFFSLPDEQQPPETQGEN